MTYLTVAFWPMALGTLVLMPFIALLAWALVGDTYHSRSAAWSFATPPPHHQFKRDLRR